MFKKILSVLGLALLVATPALAQSTAGPTVPGYWANAPQTNCPIGPCFIQYGASVPVTGTFSASLAGFNATAAATANLTDLVNVSQDVALPTGADVSITNKGSVAINFRVQTGAGVAVSTDQSLVPGATVGLHLTTQTHLSAIAPTGTGTGSTAGQLNIQGGTGLVTGYGGGSSGGSGGNVTITGPLGSRVSAQAVSVVVASDQASIPVAATLQAGSAVIGHVINDAGSAIIGKVGIDQTTPGTTNLVAAGQNGTWNITNVSGTVSLPTGASTSALQTTINSSIGETHQTVAAGTAGTKSDLAGCVYNTSAPAPTNGQGLAIQCNSTGQVQVSGGVADATSKTSQTYSAIAGVSETTPSTIANATIGYVSLDPATRALRETPLASTAGGLSIKRLLVANNNTSVAVDTSPGQMYSIEAYNNSATIAYIKLYNASQGSTTCGTGTPVWSGMIPANSTSGAGFMTFNLFGLPFSTAITSCVVTDYADNGTTAPAANAYLVNVFYK